MTSLNTRLEVARSVALPLIELERLVDEAIGVQGDIMRAVVTGREKARLPLDAGQQGLNRIAAAALQLLAAREAIHQAHYEFREVQERMGLGSRDWGDHGDTPMQFAKAQPGDAQPALKVVDAA